MPATRKGRNDTDRRAVIHRWRESGLTAEVFAKREGIAQSTLWRWARLAKSDALASSRQEPPRFVELQVPSGLTSSSVKSECVGELTIFAKNGREIRLRGSVVPDQLRTVLEVMESC